MADDDEPTPDGRPHEYVDGLTIELVDGHPYVVAGVPELDSYEPELAE